MAEVVVRAEARADLLDIYTRSVAQFGEDVAGEYMAGIDRALNRLADFPGSGPILSGIRPPIRYVPFKRHHILYDYDGATVWVARIVHHAMDAARLL